VVDVEKRKSLHILDVMYGSRAIYGKKHGGFSKKKIELS
jgi:hypothetical protein